MNLVSTIATLTAVVVVAAAIWLYTPDKPRDQLEAVYAAPPSTFVAAAGLRIHVRDTGPREGRAVIMMHGFGSSLHTWEDWATVLSAHDRVIRFDLPGFGLTGADPSGDYSDERAVAILVALMDALSVPKASLVGNSLGGKIAWMFAAEHPERVDRLVLVSPDGFASPGFEYGVQSKAPLLVRMLPYTLPTFLLRSSLAPAYGDPRALTPDLVRRYRDMLLAPGVRSAIVARSDQVILQPPGPMLARIRAPTLLVWGEKDAMIPLGNARDYTAALPDSRLVSFPALGHVPQEEAPDQSIVPVQAFLDQ